MPLLLPQTNQNKTQNSSNLLVWCDILKFILTKLGFERERVISGKTLLKAYFNFSLETAEISRKHLLAVSVKQSFDSCCLSHKQLTLCTYKRKALYSSLPAPSGADLV